MCWTEFCPLSRSCAAARPVRHSSMRRTGGCFYVAMTRARQQLVLFDCAAERSTFVDEVLSGLPGHANATTPSPRAAAHPRPRHAPRCRLWMWTASPPLVPMCGMPSLARHRGKRCGAPRDRALYGRSAHTGRPGRRGAAPDVGGVKSSCSLCETTDSPEYGEVALAQKGAMARRAGGRELCHDPKYFG